MNEVIEDIFNILKMNIMYSNVLRIKFFVLMILVGINTSCGHESEVNNKNARLTVSNRNPHLLVTQDGQPQFISNFTAWDLVRKGTRDDIIKLIDLCKRNKYNMISTVVLNDIYNSYKWAIVQYAPFESDSNGLPNLLKPIIMPGNDPTVPEEYDYWDNLDFLIDTAAVEKMYVCLLPSWGNWVVGGYNGEQEGEKSRPVLFNETNAYQYGNWLGQRYAGKDNIVWMLGGDRSAVYDSQTFVSGGRKQRILDYRKVFRALAEGLADGSNYINKQDGKADYNKTIISYHPRKWAPNSSEWFHNDSWLDFNSIQDTPYDQTVSVAHDYNLVPPKPTWLFEGRYEGRLSAWGTRYQAYQTVFSGAFGHTYGCNAIFEYPLNFQKLNKLTGLKQMAHLYTVSREIWSDSQFLNRMPAQQMIVGDEGSTFGDSDVLGATEEGILTYAKNAGSNRITAMCSQNGSWAMVYRANGRSFSIDLTYLKNGKMNAYWFNPRNGKWRVNDEEFDDQIAATKDLPTGEGTHNFDPPGDAGRDNDWVLILK